MKYWLGIFAGAVLATAALLAVVSLTVVHQPTAHNQHTGLGDELAADWWR